MSQLLCIDELWKIAMLNTRIHDGREELCL